MKITTKTTPHNITKNTKLKFTNGPPWYET
jgi:hypothetical protein